MKRLTKILKNQYISSIIIGFFFFFLPSVYSFIKSFTADESFHELFMSIWTYKIELWIIFLIAFILSLLFSFKSLKKKKNVFNYDSKSITLDQKLFDKIQYELLPQDGTIYWLRTHNFGSSFQSKYLDSLYKFENESLKSDFEFLNPELEILKNELSKEINIFLEALVSKTFVVKEELLSTSTHFSLKNPQEHQKDMENLNNLADQVCLKYDSLIKICRRKIILETFPQKKIPN